MNNQPVVGLLLVVLLLGGIWLAVRAGERQMDAVMDAWIGHSAQELVDVWGPPSRIVAAPPGAEGSLYIYEDSENTVTITPVYAPATDSDKAARVSYVTVSSSSGFAYRIFWVDAAGRIYRTAWGGLRWSSRLPNKFPKTATASS